MLYIKDKIKDAYNQSKNIYDDVLTQNKWWSKLYIRLFWGIDNIKIVENLLNMLQNDFKGSLLDVPCGTLNLTSNKYQNIPQCQITCLDYSNGMLDTAKERITKHGLSHISLMQGDVSNLPFANDTFDAVLSMNGFHVFPDKEGGYIETARVLKPNGIFLACFYIKGEYKRSDFVANSILAKKGWFTPPFQTKDEVLSVLQSNYAQVEIFSDKAMVWFRCIK